MNADPRFEMVEFVSFGFWSVISRWIWSAFLMTVTLASIITAGLIVVFIGGAVAGIAGLQPLRVAKVFFLFFSFSCAFCSVVIVPITLFGTSFRSPRSIRIVNGLVEVRRRRGSFTAPLEEYHWRIRRLASDVSGCYLPGPLIQLAHACDVQKSIVCGFTPDSFVRWQRFLDAANVPLATATPKWRTAAIIIGCSVMGGAVGTLLGKISAAIFQEPWLAAGMTFAGFLDGVVTGLWIAPIQNDSLHQMAESKWRWAYGLLLGTAFGLKSLGGVGLPVVIGMSITNGLILGAVLLFVSRGHYVRR